MEGERIYTTQTYYYWRLLGAFDFCLPFAWNILTCEKGRDKLAAIDFLTASLSLRTSGMKGSNMPGTTNCWTGFVQFPSSTEKKMIVIHCRRCRWKIPWTLTCREKNTHLFCSQKQPFHVYCELLTDRKSITFHPTTQVGVFHRTESIKEHHKNEENMQIPYLRWYYSFTHSPRSHCRHLIQSTSHTSVLHLTPSGQLMVPPPAVIHTRLPNALLSSTSTTELCKVIIGCNRS